MNSGTALLRKLWFHHLTLLRYLSPLKAGDEAKRARLTRQEVAMIDTTTETTGRRCKELRNLRTPLWDRLNLRRAWLSLRKLRLHLHSVMESQHWKKAARLRSSSKTKDSDDNTATETTGRRYKELRNLRTPLQEQHESAKKAVIAPHTLL